MSEFKKGIMLVDEYEDSIAYRVACSCGDVEHDIYIEVEYDKKFDNITLNFYKDLFIFDSIEQDILWWDDCKKHFRIKEYKTSVRELYENMILHTWMVYWGRFKKAIRIFFTGYIKMNEDFMFLDDEHFNNVIAALQEAKAKMEEHRAITAEE